jgi:chemotaxis response regulator CheB
MVSMMQQIEQTPRGFTGTISLRLTDLIQMVCLARSDLVIRVSSQFGQGTINIQNGQIQHAQTDRFQGEKAFFEVLGWNDGQFEVLPFENANNNSINKPWEHLLLEAMRHQDEMETGSPAEEPDLPDIGSLLDDLECNLQPNCPAPPSKDSPRPKAKFESLRPATRVLIVDDSSFFTKKLLEMLEDDPEIEIAGTARNGAEMLEILESGTPVDIITLDIEMPVMPGETSIKHVMIRHRLPVLIVSSIQSHHTNKVIDFLQLGAVDIIGKPGAGDDHAAYKLNIRALVKGASTARLSNFRRLRKRNEQSLPAANDAAPSGNNIVVIVGAEGAHTDWFRLPLRELCRRATVIGLQKLPDDIFPAFAQSIEESTGVKTESLLPANQIRRGRLYLGNPHREAVFNLGPDKSTIEMKTTGVEALSWKSAMESWLINMAEEARDSMKICFLSAVDPLSEATIDRLIDCNVRLILPPQQSVICEQLTGSVRPYAHIFPNQVIVCELESFPEWI